MTTRVRMRPLGLVCVRRRTALLVFVRVTVPDLTKCVDAGTGCDYLSGGGTSGPRLSVLIRICILASGKHFLHVCKIDTYKFRSKRACDHGRTTPGALYTGATPRKPATT